VVDMLSAEDEREIRTSLRKTMSGFTDEYWMRHDMDHEFPWDFHDTMADQEVATASTTLTGSFVHTHAGTPRRES